MAFRPLEDPARAMKRFYGQAAASPEEGGVSVLLDGRPVRTPGRNLLRIGATIVVLFALALWQSDLIVEGGSILGLPLALAGLVASFWGPKAMAARWRTPPGP